jgi:hypothetical protein
MTLPIRQVNSSRASAESNHFLFFTIHAILTPFQKSRRSRRRMSEGKMDQATIPTRGRRRLNARDRRTRQRRIIAGLSEGRAYDDIASEERLTTERVREIVTKVLQRRRLHDSGTHALIQIERHMRLAQAMGETAFQGDAKTGAVLLRTFKAIDVYQKVAQVSEVYDDGMRQKLLAKLNRIAARLHEESDGKEAAEREAAEAARAAAFGEAFSGGAGG